MIQMLRKRLNRKDEGFTLIELMVVVLIIAILLAIAIPTFLGARSRAQNRSAQSNLRNALTAEKTGYTDNQTYYGTASVASLQSIEPSLLFTTVAPSAGTNQVEVTTDAAGDTVCMAAVSKSGATYWIGDNGSGTVYSGSTATNYPSSGNPTCTLTGLTTVNGWYGTTSGAGW
jgi:type IV pilus assembly protein PilA